jgi:hypothetical protein
MPLFLLVLEAKARPAVLYEPLLDVIERRLVGTRILRSAWVIDAASPQAIHDSIRIYLPVEDGLVIVPYQEPMIARNLRG